jgi:hypothetical protein
MVPFVASIPSRHLSLYSKIVLAFLLLGGLLPSARAQMNFTGTSASQSFGSQSVGSVSATQKLSFAISAETTVGSFAVVTTGLANMDFANAAGTTCAVQTYTKAATCVVNVTFTPITPGLRMGAVLFFSKTNYSGKLLASVPVFGVGTGPLIAFRPASEPAIIHLPYTLTQLANPIAMAVDAAGNLFVLDAQSNPVGYRLVKLPAGGGTPVSTDPSVNGEPLYLPSCVAMDGAGDLFIGDFYGRVVEVPFGAGAATAITPTANGIPLSYASGLAVDGFGDLFIADFINNRVLELPAGGAATIAIDPTVNGVPLDDPHGLAVDASGDLFIADMGNDRVVEVPASGGTATAIAPTVDGVGLANPVGVTMDTAGDLFIADNVNGRIVELPADGGAATAIDLTAYLEGAGEAYGVTVDASGNLFVIQGVVPGGLRTLEQVQSALPLALAFPTGTYLGATDSTDGSQTTPVLNAGNEPLTLTGLSFPADFSQAPGDPNPCTESVTLSPGQQCDIPVEFTPLNDGVLTEGVTLTDNTLNATVAQQSISVTGAGESPTVLTSPVPGTTLTGSNVTFTWTAMPGATAYYLRVGTMGVGSTNLLITGKKTVTSWTVTDLPINGQTVYVRLITAYNLVQMQEDYTFTAAEPVQWSPPPITSCFQQSKSGNPPPRSSGPPLAITHGKTAEWGWTCPKQGSTRPTN